MSTGTREIAIYGAGGFGREVACLIRRISEANPNETPWKLIGFFDDGVEAGTRNPYGEVLGGLGELNAFPRELAVVMAIGTPRVLADLVGKIYNPNILFPNIFTQGAFQLDATSNVLGRGNLVLDSCISPCVTLGDFNVLNRHVSVGHDACIGNFNVFLPGAKISGYTQIGNRNLFGLNSGVFQGVKIGNDTTIGGCSFVIRKTKDGQTYVGNPAVLMRF